jgi:hypothetical protein
MCMMVGTAGMTAAGNITGWEGTYGVAWGEGCAPFASYAWTINDDAPSQHNAFIFGVQAWNPNGGSTSYTAFQSYFQDATIHMIDSDAPGISSFGVPAGWTNGSGGAAVNVLAGDYSTGVKQLNVVGPPSWSGTGPHTNPNCTYGPCTKQHSVSLPIDNMPEGANTVTVGVSDPAGNSTTQQSKTVYVDRTPPAVPTLDGFLVDADGTMTDGVPYDVTASTSDALSHPASMTLSVDGTVVSQVTCDDQVNCAGSLSWTPTSAQAGDHTLVVTATDRAGNTASAAPMPAHVDTAVITETSYTVDPNGDGTTDVPPASGETDYCAAPADPCEDPYADSDADAAVAAETSPDDETPLIVGDPADFTPSSGAAAALSGPLARKGYGWALSDQKPETFTTVVPGTSTLALNDLSIERVRRTVAFDTVWRVKNQTTYDRGPNTTAGACPTSTASITVSKSQAGQDSFDKWLNAAIDSGREPVISFEFSKADPGPNPTGEDQDGSQRKGRCALPTQDQYRQAVNAFLKRYRKFRGGAGAPRIVTAWNEPNDAHQPTFGSATGGQRAGQFFSALRRLCSNTYNCTVAAGDFIDNNYIGRYTTYFRQGAKMTASNPPAAWAYHPYSSAANSTSLANAESRYAAVKAGFVGVAGSHHTPVWITEIGGFYTKAAGESEATAQARQRTQLCRMIQVARNHSEIKRFYQYELRGGPPFDTGLMDSNGNKRSVYDTYRYYSAKAGSSSNAC